MSRRLTVSKLEEQAPIRVQNTTVQTGDRSVVVDPPGRDAAASLAPVHQTTPTDRPYEVTTPLWPAHTIVINPKEPRTEEANGPEAHLVSVVGAAWLLMGQPGVTETRAIAAPPPAATGRRGPASRTEGHHRRTAPPSSASPQDDPGRTSDRQFSRRWWVGGHWRQQACGPNHSNAGRNGLPRISKGRKTSR